MNELEQSRVETQSFIQQELDIVSLVKDIEASKNRNPVITTESTVDRIKRLHCEVASYYLIALAKAVEIGQLLTGQKEEMKHGEFMPWIEKNMPFSTATARNYMKLWRNRELLKMLNVSNLKAAYTITKGAGPTIIPYPELESPFASVRHPDPFSHCDDEQKRKWLAKWIIQIQDGMPPWDSWQIMEWTTVRYTFDGWFDETKAKINGRRMSKTAIQKIKKKVNYFLEKYKDIDLLKLKFTCLNLFEA